MNDQEITRQNNISDADLVADCRQRLSQARLDLSDLQAEGVTAADLDSFEAEVAAFEKLPSDEALEYARVALRETRDTALETGRNAVRDVLNPVRRATATPRPNSSASAPPPLRCFRSRGAQPARRCARHRHRLPHRPANHPRRLHPGPPRRAGSRPRSPAPGSEGVPRRGAAPPGGYPHPHAGLQRFGHPLRQPVRPGATTTIRLATPSKPAPTCATPPP
jgi:hypothetical protein